MPRSLLVALFAIAFALIPPARAAENGSEPASVSAVRPRPKLLVLELTAEAQDRALAQVVLDVATTAFAREPNLDVLSGVDVKNLADFEASKQASGCDESASCLAELAGALGADFVMFGRITHLGTLTLVALTLVDTKAAQAIERTSFEVAEPEQVPGRVRAEIGRFVAAVTNAFARKVGAARGMASFESAEPPAAATSSFPRPLLGWGLVGVGIVLVGSGATFDALSPSSRNKVIDAYDFIGPSVVVTGVVMGLAGIGLLVTPDADPPR